MAAPLYTAVRGGRLENQQIKTCAGDSCSSHQAYPRHIFLLDRSIAALLHRCNPQGCNGYFKVTREEKPQSYDPQIFENRAHGKFCEFGNISESGEFGEID